MSFLKKREYSESPALEELASRIANSTPELIDSLSAKWRVIYSSTELEHLAGKCRKLDGALKFQTKLDFIIFVHRPPFMEMDERRKFRVICHELYHIEQKEKGFKVRKHGGDFCEIESHDTFSFELADRAMQTMKVRA